MPRTLQRLGTSVAIAAGACLLSAQGFGQAPLKQSTEAPQGWYVYANEELRNANAADRRCFNYSRQDWRVILDEGKARFTNIGNMKYESPASPPRLVHQEGMTRLRSATQIDDVWLLAYDGGEFGGGLWITNEDGSEVKQIYDSNVQAAVPLGSRVLVLSGLAHMQMDAGDALIYSSPRAMNMALQKSIKLDGAPRTFVQESDGSVLFVTTHSLCRITVNGELKILHTFPSWTAQQYANSMAATPDGSIYVGMRMFVLKLNDKGGEYTEEWMLPEDCRKLLLQADRIDCSCSPR